MRVFFFLTLLAVLCGCETTVRKEKLEPVQSGQRISLSQQVTIYETRGPLALKLEWQLLPGVYVERYTTELGRMFQSEGPLVQFTPTIGGKTRQVGGFILLKGQPGVAKLYVVSRGDMPAMRGLMDVAIAHALVIGPGDISLVTDFPRSQLPAGLR
jgi:hypothetical protein